jgi:aspartate ammonia-lyase
MALLRLLPALLGALADLNRSLARKAKQFDPIVKLGRTQLSDAIPIRLGQEFRAWRAALMRAADRLRQHMKMLRSVNLGGTAIGTCLNAGPYYQTHIIPVLNEITGLDLRRAGDLVDATQNTDDYLALSSSLRGCAVALAKLASDLRLLSSGPNGGLGEITLPARQNGSSIMPGKINPVIPEVVNQIAFAIIGHDVTAALVAQAGQLELNAFEPVLFDQLLSDIAWLTHGIRTLDINCIRDISANSDRCREHLARSTALATALAPVIGYQRSAAIAKRALQENRSIQDLIEQAGLDDRMIQACLAAVRQMR